MDKCYVPDDYYFEKDDQYIYSYNVNDELISILSNLGLNYDYKTDIISGKFEFNFKSMNFDDLIELLQDVLTYFCYCKSRGGFDV